MSDLEQRVKALETKVKILEETLETLKNMQLSEQMDEYIQSKSKSLKLVNLINSMADDHELDFSKEENSVQNVRATKNAIDQQIAAALRSSGDFSEQYPNDSRYFNYEIESGVVTDWIYGQKEDMHIKDMCDVIDLYKYGIKDNPWNKLSIAELKTAEDDFRARVKGQDYAIVKTLDIIKRAVTGMSGVQTASHGKPKGVLFFAVHLQMMYLWNKINGIFLKKFPEKSCRVI